MHKKLSLFLVIILALTLLTGCIFPSIISSTSTVNYYVDGRLYKTQTVVSGTCANSIKAPDRNNQIFVGWFLDPNHTVEFDFSTKIYMDTNLYAYYTIDAISTTELMTKTIMKSVVTVENKCFNTGLGGLVEMESVTAQGSGVVIDVSGGYCYVLTNAHVVEKEDGYSEQMITIEDAWGNKFPATLYQHPNSQKPAIDHNYDLALVCFKYNPNAADEDEKLVEIVTVTDPAINSYVVSIGSPLGQKNAITYGSVYFYTKLNQTDKDGMANVNFEIIVHSAVINHGSSGGPLLSTSGKLVGLNFAGLETDGTGCAISVSKINEFLKLYVYLK